MSRWTCSACRRTQSSLSCYNNIVQYFTLPHTLSSDSRQIEVTAVLDLGRWTEYRSLTVWFTAQQQRIAMVIQRTISWNTTVTTTIKRRRRRRRRQQQQQQQLEQVATAKNCPTQQSHSLFATAKLLVIQCLQTFVPLCINAGRSVCLSVCLFVRLSVKRVNCDKTKETYTKLFTLCKMWFHLVFWQEEWLLFCHVLTF